MEVERHELEGMRLRALREGIGLSQSRFADVIGQATPTVKLLRKYADYFDVSMDYIFARCDDPHGTLYEANPPVDANNPKSSRSLSCEAILRDLQGR